MFRLPRRSVKRNVRGLAKMGAFARSIWRGGRRKAKKSVFKRRRSRNVRNRYKKQKYTRFGGDDIHSGTGGNTVKLRINMPVKGMVRRGGHLRYVYDLSQTHAGPAGKQTASQLLAIGSTSQWYTSTGTTYAWNQSHTKWFDLDPNALPTGSAFYDQTPALSGKLVLQKAYIDSYLANQTDVEQDVVIYIIKARKHCENDPLTDWNDSLVSEGLGKNSFSQNAGGSGALASGGIGYSDYTLARSSPRGELFMNNWKILFSKKIALAAASTYNMKTFLEMNMFANKEVYAHYSNKGIIYPKGTVIMLATINGQIVWDASYTKVSGLRSNTFAEQAVGMIHKVHLSFKPYVGTSKTTAEVDVTKLTLVTDPLKEVLIDVVDGVNTVKRVFDAA